MNQASFDPFLSHGLRLGVPYHIGLAVYDVDAAIRRYSETFGITDWKGLPSPEEAPAPLWHGRPQPGARLRWAYANTEWPWLEVVQPLGDVEWTVPTFLREHGEGVYHVGYFVDDIAVALRQAEEAGIEADYLSVQEGEDGQSTGIAYMSPRNTHGLMIELVSNNLRTPLTNFVRTGEWTL